MPASSPTQPLVCVCLVLASLPTAGCAALLDSTYRPEARCAPQFVRVDGERRVVLGGQLQDGDEAAWMRTAPEAHALWRQAERAEAESWRWFRWTLAGFAITSASLFTPLPGSRPGEFDGGVGRARAGLSIAGLALAMVAWSQMGEPGRRAAKLQLRARAALTTHHAARRCRPAEEQP